MNKKPSHRISLRSRIYGILAALIFITLMGGGVMVWYTYRMEGILSAIIDKDIAAFQTAVALETALINQKGFVSYYFLDGDPDWLKQLGEHRQIFKERIKAARSNAHDAWEIETIDRIASEYQRYITDKDSVIRYYQSGQRSAGTALHQTVRSRFFSILALCEQYKKAHTNRVAEARETSRIQARNLRLISVFAMVVASLLAALLASMLIFQILDPIRKLSRETDPAGQVHRSGNEISTLRQTVEGLLDDVGQTQSELERSREHLLQAEKMAMVGRLAAGMAHSIRNPFTSVKMRLFSLSRGLHLTETQKDDFTVIDEEIRHIDQIVQNFLEFSRPPKLKMQTLCPSVVVDNALQILEHRLKSYDVDIVLDRRRHMPLVEADPEQLKEVLVNIIVNACEAMSTGGTVTIQETVVAERHGQSAVIRIRDTGPGIPESIRNKVFQPFFTTKDEGTGLGLSIAARIIEELGGRLNATSPEGGGASFVIALPAKESTP